MAEKAKTSWAYHEALPLGVLNRLNRDITKRRFQTGQESDFSSILSDIFEVTYGPDIKKGSGPYAAVVLDILTGPQTNDSAQSDDKLKSKSHPIGGRDVIAERRASANLPPPVTVIAKIPEFDSDLPWPANDKDQKRIQLHGEFRQINESQPGISNITQGSIIWVQYINDDELASHSGGPTGYIIGVHTAKALTQIITELDLGDTFNPPCKIAIDKNKPAPGFYIGDRPGTDPDPSPGLVDLKIKNHIKTGMFGNGHPRTKAHFKSALSSFDKVSSYKHNLGAPAPGPNNAFIWIGHLKNNGYMDLLDRPNDKGRETIIYAPATLDLNAPVEIKYYFHDEGGFGAAHVNGPNMPVEQAEFSATAIMYNDFAQKIAPAILDLNMEGRNYVLVIPEMAYSRGYGTRNDDLNRIEKFIDGRSMGAGAQTDSTSTTVRSSPTPEIRGLLKSYLSTIPVESGKTLAQNTPLRLRQLSTFDGTYSGGDFGKFHDEVLDVLDEYIYNSVGGVFDKVEFVSFVADGLGSIALSGILNKVTNSTTQAAAASSLKNLFNREVGLRIDYITTPELDSLANSLLLGFSNTQTPSDILVKELLLPREDIFYTEFNYITSPTINSDNLLFNNLGRIEDYKKHSNNPGVGSNANKFSFRLGNFEGDQRFITLHVVKEAQKTGNFTKAGYAFSMINEFLPSSVKYPKKGDKNSQLKPGFAGTPDHHQALSSTKSQADLEKLEKQLEELEESAKYFSEVLNIIFKPGSLTVNFSGGFAVLCQDSKYKQFCNENGVIEQSSDSLFNIEYRKYLRRLKKIEEIKILLDPNQGGPFIEQNRSSIKALENLEKQYLVLYENTKADIEENFVSENESTRQFWENLNTGIAEYSKRVSEYQQGNGVAPDLRNLALLVSRPEAYAKLLNKTRSYMRNFIEPSVKKPEDCVPPPIKLEYAALAASAASYPDDSNCEKVSSLLAGPVNVGEYNPPKDFVSLATILGYREAGLSPFSVPTNPDPALPPTKGDFKFTGKASKTKIKDSNLPQAFKTRKFRYKSRGPNNKPTAKISPHVWSCLSEKISEKWNEACEISKYYPYIITSGIKASEKLKVGGVCAYKKGLSLHAFGLGIDVDPHLNVQSLSARHPVYSVWTGAWSINLLNLAGIGSRDTLKNFERLHQLGIFREKPEKLARNIFVDKNYFNFRSTTGWQGAPSAKVRQSPDSARVQKYNREMKLNSAVEEHIVPLEANPTLWVIEFCERTGFRWANSFFMKKRHKGGSTWTEPEKKEISKIYGINNVVDRIQAISWNGPGDQHMRFDFWAGDGGLISWKEVEEFIEIVTPSKQRAIRKAEIKELTDKIASDLNE
jgi:hypothetical protein